MADISQCSWKRYQRRSSNIQFHTSWPQQLAFPDMMTSLKEVKKRKKVKKENCAIFRCLRTDSKSFAKEIPTDCHLPWCKTINFSCRAITMKINKKKSNQSQQIFTLASVSIFLLNSTELQLQKYI